MTYNNAPAGRLTGIPDWSLPNSKKSKCRGYEHWTEDDRQFWLHYFTDIYNDMWLKRYATALVKYQWGQNLSKFGGIALPGGVVLEPDNIKSEALEEKTRLEEESRLNYEMPVLDMMG